METPSNSKTVGIKVIKYSKIPVIIYELFIYSKVFKVWYVLYKYEFFKLCSLQNISCSGFLNNKITFFITFFIKEKKIYLVLCLCLKLPSFMIEQTFLHFVRIKIYYFYSFFCADLKYMFCIKNEHSCKLFSKMTKFYCFVAKFIESFFFTFYKIKLCV